MLRSAITPAHQVRCALIALLPLTLIIRHSLKLHIPQPQNGGQHREEGALAGLVHANSSQRGLDACKLCCVVHALDRGAPRL